MNSKGAIERYATEPWTRLFHINALSADSSKHKLSGDGSILAWWAPEDEDGAGSAVVLSEVNTGKDLHSEWFDQNNCSSVFISPDGSLFGVVDQIKQIHLWDVKTGEKVSVSPDPRSNEVSFEFAEFVVFSPDGRFLCGSDVDVVYIWDLAIKEQVQILRGHSHISALSYSPDGKLLAVADEGSIRSWDLGSGEETCRIEVMKGRIDRMAFSPDGRLLAGSRDPRILWLADVSMGALLFDLRFSDAEIECLSFSPDSRQLIALTKGARLHRWLRPLPLSFCRPRQHAEWIACHADVSRNDVAVASLSHPDQIKSDQFVSRSRYYLLRHRIAFLYLATQRLLRYHPARARRVGWD